MFIRIISTALDTAIPWFQVVVSPERLHALLHTKDPKTIAPILPDILIKHSADALQHILLKLIRDNFTGHTADEIEHTLCRVRIAHDKTGELRDNGQPYIQHVYMTTLLAWTFAHLFCAPGTFDPRHLLLSCLYHDAIEDTHIFQLSDPGKQICRIAKLHGESIAITVGYLTKMPLHVNKEFPALKTAYIAAHYTTFLSPECSWITRFYKCCDRIANFSDFDFSPRDFFFRKLEETNTYFPKIITTCPEPFQTFFWEYIQSKATHFGNN